MGMLVVRAGFSVDADASPAAHTFNGQCVEIDDIDSDCAYAIICHGFVMLCLADSLALKSAGRVGRRKR